MGGDLWVKSEYGKGSQFFFTTKARRGNWSLDQVRQKMIISHPGRRILHIETLGQDTSISEAVQACGLHSVHVNSIEEACEQKGLFDSVLVDQTDLVERVREVESLRYIPLVLISTHIAELNLKEALDNVGRQLAYI
jgi:osomolarity two-component system sensor histidine kinase NIK1